MSKRILLLGALVLLVVGALQLRRERSAALEADLRLQAIRQLSIERVMGVNPRFEGRDVTLKGKVVSEEEKARAEAVVAAIEGVGQVTNALDVGPMYPPPKVYYFLDIAWRDSGINLRGRVPDEASKALLLTEATEIFGGPLVTDRIEIDTTLGAADWIRDVAAVLPDLSEAARPGRLKGTAEKIVLAGIVASEESGSEIEEAVRKQIPDIEVQSYLRTEEETSGES